METVTLTDVSPKCSYFKVVMYTPALSASSSSSLDFCKAATAGGRFFFFYWRVLLQWGRVQTLAKACRPPRSCALRGEQESLLLLTSQRIPSFYLSTSNPNNPSLRSHLCNKCQMLIAQINSELVFSYKKNKAARPAGVHML